MTTVETIRTSIDAAIAEQKETLKRAIAVDGFASINDVYPMVFKSEEFLNLHESEMSMQQKADLKLYARSELEKLDKELLADGCEDYATFVEDFDDSHAAFMKKLFHAFLVAEEDETCRKDVRKARKRMLSSTEFAMLDDNTKENLKNNNILVDDDGDYSVLYYAGLPVDF